MTTSVFILITCLLLSMFFSGTETAVTASSEALIHELEKKGDQNAKRLKKLKNNPDRFLSMILFGNNVVNITATAVTTSLCITFLGAEWGVFISTFVVSFIVLIFCEILPKTIAMRFPNTIALNVAPIVSALTFVLAPLVIFLNTIVRQAIKVCGLMKKEKLSHDERVELRGAIDLHKTASMKNEATMMKSVLDLSEVSVGDIMTHRAKIVSINADLPASEIISKVLSCPYTRVPLWRGRQSNIVGVLHSKLLIRALQARKGDLKNFDIMQAATAPWFVLETTSLLDQMQAYRQRHEHFALIVDEYGVLQGIVTLEDILEEIVGDIADETDAPITSDDVLKPLQDGSIIVDGATPIRDLNRHFGWELPDDEASTIAGLLLYETECIPLKGSTYSFYGFTFQVLDKRGNRLTQIRIQPATVNGEEN